MNAYTADQITLAQEIVAGKHNRVLQLRPLAEPLGIPLNQTRTQIWNQLREKAKEIALLAPVDAEEEEEDAASVSTTESAPAPAPAIVAALLAPMTSAEESEGESEDEEEAAPVELSPAEFAWESALTTEADRKAEFIRLHQENERLTDLVRKLKSIPTASPITPSAAPAPKAKAVKAVKAAKEAKPKAAPAARVSTKGADLSAMLEDGESVFSKELINEGESKGEYRLCEGRWNVAKKGFGLFIDGELQGDYVIKSPTTLVSAFRQWMNTLGESKQSASTTCGFAKCFVVREGKEQRLKALLPAPTTA